MKAGWESKLVGDVLLKTETVNPASKPEQEFEYIDVSSVSNETFTVVDTQHLLGKDAPSRARKLVRTDDILFATIRPTLQRIALVPEHLDAQVCSTGYFVLRAGKQVLSKYLFHYLFTREFTAQMESLQKGASYPAVNDSDVRSQLIAYPSLKEQKRIVTLIDEAFAHIATAKANAEQNLQNARALFESHLQSVFSRRNKGWLNKPLGDCVNAISTGPFGSLLHKSDYVFGGTPLVNPINIAGEEIVSNPNKTVSTETVDRLHAYKLRENDIVIARRGEIGRCAVVQKDQSGWLCGTGCFIIRPSKSTDPHYLTHLLRSAHYRKQLEGVSDRATMPSISNSDLSSLVVVLPPITEQLNFLERIKLLSTETQRLESIYQQKLTALDALKKSLLHQAFCGQL